MTNISYFFRTIDVLRDKPSIIIDANDQHLSPINNTRRSQFAPVLSSTPVHQISPITPIPVDLSCIYIYLFLSSKVLDLFDFFSSVATSTAAPVLTINSTDLPAVPPSAIVPQRANLARAGGRPPRIPRGESVPRQKKVTSPIKEQQQEETILTKEVHVTSKRRIKSKQEIIEDNIEVIIELDSELVPDIIKQVQATPLRGRKKKVIQEDNNPIPELEPPPPLALSVPENEIPPKKTRAGRSKTKKVDEVEEEVKPTRAASARNRKKQQQQEEVVVIEEKVPTPPPAKKTTRNKKLVEPVVNIEEVKK